MAIALPKGVRDFLPETAERMKVIEEGLSSTFELWGYRKVITPVFEYLDALALAEPNQLERMFKFEDRGSGKMLALRPDITAQVARLVASHLQEHPKPLRLHYSGNVLRYGERDNNSQRMVFQAGLELVGLDLPEADGEVIAISIEALKSTGLTDFKIDVGQVEFFRGVLEELNLEQGLREKLESAVARKDRSGIEELLPQLNLKNSEEETILSLPTLFGDRQVLSKAEGMNVNSRAKKALENLSLVLDTVDSYGLMDYITVDLGEIRGLNYYTGVIFEGFACGTGEALCGGGRYDSLLGRYGYDTPATGFALNIETVMKALESQVEIEKPKFTDYLIVNCKKDKGDALKIAKLLRSKGIRVARDILKRTVAESISFARSENIGGLILVGGESVLEEVVMVHNLDTDVKSVFK